MSGPDPKNRPTAEDRKREAEEWLALKPKVNMLVGQIVVGWSAIDQQIWSEARLLQHRLRMRKPRVFGVFKSFEEHYPYAGPSVRARFKYVRNLAVSLSKDEPEKGNLVKNIIEEALHLYVIRNDVAHSAMIIGFFRSNEPPKVTFQSVEYPERGKKFLENIGKELLSGKINKEKFWRKWKERENLWAGQKHYTVAELERVALRLETIFYDLTSALAAIPSFGAQVETVPQPEPSQSRRAP